MTTSSPAGPCSTPFHVATRVDQGHATAEIAGEIDIFAWKRLSTSLAEIQARAERPGLVLVLTDLAFIDSSGLGALVTAMRRARQAGGAVALVRAPDSLLKTLRITGLSELLPSFNSLEAAWAHLDGVAW